MVRLADGDRGAFSVLLDELWPVILAFAHSGLGHHQDAEDVAQEVFVRICACIADFDRGRDGVAWAFAIAGYEVLTERRRRQRRREVSSDAGLEQTDPGASQEEAAIQREHARALALALGELSEDDRVTLGLAGEAAALAIKEATLRKRRERALGRLRLIWRRIHGES